MKLLHKLPLVLGLGMILAVDLVYKTVAMLALSPGPLEAVGFVALGLVITGLIPAAILTRKHWLWACLALVSVFLDVSFALESTRNKGQVLTVSNDGEVARLDAELARLFDQEAQVQARYDEALRLDRSKPVLLSISDNLSEKQAEIKAVNESRKARVKMLETEKPKPAITGDDIFAAIPRAAGVPETKIPKPAIELCFFLLLFVSVQGALVSFLKKETAKEVPEVSKEVAPEASEVSKETPETVTEVPAYKGRGDQVWQFVSLTWGYAKRGSDRAMSKETFFKILSSKGRSYDVEQYDRLRGICENKGYLVDGRLIELDPDKVYNFLRR